MSSSNVLTRRTFQHVPIWDVVKALRLRNEQVPRQRVYVRHLAADLGVTNQIVRRRLYALLKMGYVARGDGAQYGGWCVLLSDGSEA